MLKSGTRFDNDSYYEMMIDEEQNTARIIGENNGVPVDWEVGGSSDFSIANVTLIETATGLFDNVQFPAIVICDHVDPPVECIKNSGAYGNVGTANLDIPLYKGGAVLITGADTSQVTVTVTSGNAEVYTYTDEWGTYADVLVKGDCTITYSSPT